MSENTIRIYGDPVLRMKAQRVDNFGEHLLPFVEQLFETCINNDGAGLAAPQIGESIQMAVVRIPGENEDDEPLKVALFNPDIIDNQGESVFEEACLSIPGIKEEVTRPDKITVKFQDYMGEMHEIETDGYLARVLQHEIDHLHGVLFVDHLPPVKKALIKGKLKKLAAGELPDE